MSLLQNAAPADSIRAALRQIFAAPEYDWDVRRNPFQFLLDGISSIVAWLAELETAHPVVYWVLWGILTGLLLAILAHLGYLIYRALRLRTVPPAVMPESTTQRRDAAWHLSEARRLAGLGRYDRALAQRFAALLLDLDRYELIRFHPSKTPAEYVGEVGSDGVAATEYRALVGILYAHLFGGAACSDRDFATFDGRAAELVARHANA